MIRFADTMRPGHLRHRRVVLYVIAGCVCCFASGLTRTSAQVRDRLEMTPSLAFISDTQAPLFLETIRLRTDKNEEATRALFRCIASDSSCIAVFHLGDFVSMGWSSSSWGDFDEKSAPLRTAHIPLYPALGNHEYILWGAAGKAPFENRFPRYKEGWYVQRADGIGVVILNSNIPDLSEAEQLEQQQWYDHQLDTLDADSSISAVIVGCHHSPYTNSTIVEPSEEVQRRFVPSFLQSKKAVLFLSGHAHAAEHFLYGGKNFVVLGGGGGLLHPLLSGEQQRWKDLFVHTGDRSGFHYLRINRDAGMILVRVVALGAGGPSCAEAYSFAIAIH